MLKEFLEGNIHTAESVSDWEESVKKASEPILRKGFVSENYIDSMIRDIKNLGFYIVLRDGVAMPHSRPENGVFKTAMSLLKLKKPVNYGEKEVKLIFVLAAKDTEEHIEALKGLSELLQNDNETEILLNTESLSKITEIINKY